jgi:subtilisin family serine protease
VSIPRLTLAGVLVATCVGISVPSGADDRAGLDEYVVVFDRSADGGAGAGAAASMEQVVGQAGGRVVDVNEALGVALVRTVEAGFRSAVGQQPGITGVMPNHSVGLERPDMPHRYAQERPAAAERAQVAAPSGARAAGADTAALAEPLAARQWNMAMIGAGELPVTGAGVDVGIIDTGVDAAHPDLAPNFDAGRSRNFTTDIPSIDGPCEVPSCVDPVGADDRGHGTHVAGVVAAARNGMGMAGVAPDATLVNLRAGQDSGLFFLYETLDAVTAAGDLQLDVVNMSFYTDPWLYNCDSPDDYLDGTPTEEELEQQRLTRRLLTEALEYAHDRGVTMVAAVGNEHADLSAPQRYDGFSPGFPPGSRKGRLVSRDCLDLPNEGPHVISVGSVGPSGTKADYSNYGLGSIDVVGPGGWSRDGAGTPGYQQPGNLVLGPYPSVAAREQDLVDAAGNPVDGYTLRDCGAGGACGVYTYLQGTSMAAPHVVGVAALIVQRHGAGSPAGGFSLAPDQVAARLASTATDQACPAGGSLGYGAAGRDAEWTAACAGTPANNGLYGEGIVNAAAATR